MPVRPRSFRSATASASVLIAAPSNCSDASCRWGASDGKRERSGGQSHAWHGEGLLELKGEGGQRAIMA